MMNEGGAVKISDMLFKDFMQARPFLTGLCRLSRLRCRRPGDIASTCAAHQHEAIHSLWASGALSPARRHSGNQVMFLLRDDCRDSSYI